MSLAPASNNPKIFLKAKLYKEKDYSVKNKEKRLLLQQILSRINFPKKKTFLKARLENVSCWWWLELLILGPSNEFI